MMSNFSKLHFWWIPLFMIVFCSFQDNSKSGNIALVKIKLIFKNNVKRNKIVLIDSTYRNPFGEAYIITKLRYYVSDISLQQEMNEIKEKNSYHLVDESEPQSQALALLIPGGNYRSLNFLLGVDSLHNVSGAQTGDLDPAKDMFWTWNSGYVMAKMEGNSPASKLVNNKFEFHIGGFSGRYNVLKKIHLTFPDKFVHFTAGKTYKITIDADINTWWQNPHDIKISEHANITSPGKNAMNVSDNYAHMFYVEKIISE